VAHGVQDNVRKLRPRSPWSRWLVATIAALLVFPVLVGSAGTAWLLIEDTGTPAPDAHATGTDGLWLGHAWVAGGHPPADLAALVTEVRTDHLRDLFVHIGPLADDGTLDPRLRPTAGPLLTALHEQLPGVRVQAWLGDVVGPTRYDLADPATRAHTLTSVDQVLAAGFDGIHYDLEPVPDGDPGYLALLAATHTLTKSAHKVLSVAVDQLEPLPALRYPAQWVTGRPHFWSTGFVHAVALDVDEVAVMAYDSGMPTSAVYSGYVRRQTQLAMSAIPSTVDLLIGAPAYHTTEPGHTAAETVAAAVRGIRLAWTGRPIGIAFYADFSATPADWSAYRSGWVNP
jgi:hypothetical protein